MISHEYLTIKQVCERIPHRPHVATIWRWIQRGIKGRKLRATRFGGRTFIALGDLHEFLDDQKRPTSNPGRQQDLAKVERDLERELL